MLDYQSSVGKIKSTRIIDFFKSILSLPNGIYEFLLRLLKCMLGGIKCMLGWGSVSPSV